MTLPVGGGYLWGNSWHTQPKAQDLHPAAVAESLGALRLRGLTSPYALGERTHHTQSPWKHGLENGGHA